MQRSRASSLIRGSPWRAWLSSLGRDSSAALAAGALYRELGGSERDAWLDAVFKDLAEDGGGDEGRLAAALAPLLSCEEDPTRRARILSAITSAGLGSAAGATRAMHGRMVPAASLREGREDVDTEGRADARSVVALFRRVAFELDEALVCVLAQGPASEKRVAYVERIVDARYVGLASEADASRLSAEMGVVCTLSACDPDFAIDRLAHAIVSGLTSGLTSGRASGRASTSKDRVGDLEDAPPVVESELRASLQAAAHFFSPERTSSEGQEPGFVPSVRARSEERP